jgi:hypothetical protein
MNRLGIAITLISVTILPLRAQIGGKYAYGFLNLSPSARTTALGGAQIAVSDHEAQFAMLNPAVLQEETSGQASLSHQFHFADIQHTHVDYGFAVRKPRVFAHVGWTQMYYGQFQYADVTGNRDNTTFQAAESALTLGVAKHFEDKLSVGVNIKTIYSSLEAYNSFGMAADIGFLYHLDSAKTATVGLVIKNMGGELKTYTEDRAAAPFDIQLAYAKKLKYLPFRFTILLHQLHRWNIRYDDPGKNATVNIFNEQDTDKPLERFVDNVFRHTLFSGEFILGKKKNLWLRGAYAHMTRREMLVPPLRSMSGFSLGVGIRIKYLRLDYGVNYLHLAGATNHLTLSTNWNDWRKKP